MTTKPRHVILGAGGAIGQVLARELLGRGESVKLVSRRGHGLPDAESVRADLLDSTQTTGAIDRGAIVYLLAGLPYRTSVWREQWPRLMANVIAGCKAKEARLIFFDNIYMYGRVAGPITENAPIRPCSRKGEVRARIAETLLREARDGDLRATIARAADFYGPYADTTSVPFLLCIKRLAAGKRAQVLVDASRKHSYTYTADSGRALVALAQSNETNGQVWHLPTARPAPTGEEFTALVARELDVEPRIQVLGKWMVGLAGLFDRQTMELYEMLYQNAHDYEFDSTRFEQAFELRPTSYEEGVAATIRHFREAGAI